MRLSATKVKMYQTCPQRYRYRYLDRLPGDESGEAARIGLAVHAVLEAAGRLVLEGWDPGKAAAPDCLRSGLAGLMLSGGREAPPPGPIADAAAEILATVAPDLDLSHVEAVEQEISLDLDGVRVIGYVDRIDRTTTTATVVDYKSGQAPPPNAEDLALDPQAGIYLCWARERWPEAELAAVWHYVAQGRMRRVAWSPELDGWHRRELRATAAAIQAKAFAPRTGDHCAYCPWQDRCQAFARWLARGLPPRETGDMLSDLAAARDEASALSKAAESRRKALDERLAALLGEERSREARGWRVYRVRGRTTVSYPPEAVEAVWESGAKVHALYRIWESVGKVDAKRLEAWAEKHGASDALAEHVRTRTGSGYLRVTRRKGPE